MCGIVSYIGEPKDSLACYKLTTELLRKTEIRGDDAAGYWACDTLPEDEGAVYWTKTPAKATDFVKTDSWEILEKLKLNLLVAHCRRSTVKGSENINRNNHPFVTADNRTALVHNGNVPEFEALRDNYNIISECDSEILLRMMERGSLYDIDFIRTQLGQLQKNYEDKKLIKDCQDDEIPNWAWKVSGLIDIFARINYGAMAVAIGERWPDGTRALWLFRDRDRPLHVVDLRDSLGQIYAVSEKSIWRSAVEATPMAKKYVKGNTPIIEFPPMFIWLLTYNALEKDLEKQFQVRKFKINRKRKFDTTFEEERPKTLLNPPNMTPIRVVTNLNHDHCPSKTKPIAPIQTNPNTVKKDSKKNESTNQSNQTNNTNGLKTSNHSANGQQYHPLHHSQDQMFRHWPRECYVFMIRHITEHTEPNDKQQSMINVVHLESAADNTNIPDPSSPTVVLTKDDYLAWDTTLKTKYRWHNRVKNGEQSALWHAIQQAHMAWLNYIEKLERTTQQAVDSNAEGGEIEAPPFLVPSGPLSQMMEKMTFTESESAEKNADPVKYKNPKGELHREDGPAIEYKDGRQYWWINGVQLTKAEFDDRTLHREVDSKGNTYYRNAAGNLHRNNGPAIEFKSGEKHWYQNDKLHRESGPAIEKPHGESYWYKYGSQIAATSLYKPVNQKKDTKAPFRIINHRSYNNQEKLMDDFQQTIQQMRESINDIETHITNLATEGTISDSELVDLISSLQDISTDIAASKFVAESLIHSATA